MKIIALIKSLSINSNLIKKEMQSYTTDITKFRGNVGVYLLADGLTCELTKIHDKQHDVSTYGNEIMLCRVIRKYLKSIKFDYWKEQAKYL